MVNLEIIFTFDLAYKRTQRKFILLRRELWKIDAVRWHVLTII